MTLYNKLTATFVTLMLPLSAGCSLVNIATSPIGNNPINKNNVTFDVGNGKKTSAAFSINLNFFDSEKFSVKNSSSGQAGHTKSDIQLIRFYLVDTNSSTIVTPNIKFGPFDIKASSTGSLLTLYNNLKGLGGTGTITFTDVTNGTFYAAVAAYSSTVTIDSTTNITNLSTSAGFYANVNNGTNLGNFALSSSGGDSGGQITVGAAPTYNLGTPTALIVNLKLADAFGATIDSIVNVSDGSNIYTGSPILQ